MGGQATRRGSGATWPPPTASPSPFPGSFFLLSPRPTRPSPSLSQVEFADVLVLNKADLVPPDALAALEALLRRLNPAADVLRASYAVVPVRPLLLLLLLPLPLLLPTPRPLLPACSRSAS